MTTVADRTKTDRNWAIYWAYMRGLGTKTDVARDFGISTTRVKQLIERGTRERTRLRLKQEREWLQSQGLGWLVRAPSHRITVEATRAALLLERGE